MSRNLWELANGALLSQVNGKKVSVTGMVTKFEPNGLSIEMKTTDGFNVFVKLQKPISDNLSGYIEVHGLAQGKSILADEVIYFEDDGMEQFDAASHNILCGLINSIPDIFKTKV